MMCNVHLKDMAFEKTKISTLGTTHLRQTKNITEIVFIELGFNYSKYSYAI